MPIALWYATGDQITLPGAVHRFARRVRARRDPRLVMHPLFGGHAETTLSKVPPAEVVGFVRRHLRD